MRFDVVGPMRFVSHAEMMRVFQRACTRASIPVKHSEGFNPRPKMSLPLPRTVGVESRGDILFMQVLSERGKAEPVQPRELAGSLKRELPEGCRITAVEFVSQKKPPRPESAVYIMALRARVDCESLGRRAAEIMDKSSIVVSRSGAGRGRSRDVDVRPFIAEIRIDGPTIRVRCGITPAGSIRVEEIQDLLGIGDDDLAEPIRRDDVKWIQA